MRTLGILSPRFSFLILIVAVVCVLFSYHSILTFCFRSSTLQSAVDSDVFSDVYHSPEVFRLDYGEMEKKFKIYIYPDGDPNTYYQTPRKLTGKYASEGYFFQNIRESQFRTDEPERAHLFFIPISCHKMRGKGTSYENMTIVVKSYVESLIAKYPYWNRTLGTDHFFVTCHDIGVRATEGLPLLVKNSIRVVCSPSYDVGFIPHKDVPLPQVLQPFALPAGGNNIANRFKSISNGIPLLSDMTRSTWLCTISGCAAMSLNTEVGIYHTTFLPLATFLHQKSFGLTEHVLAVHLPSSVSLLLSHPKLVAAALKQA
ncbi:hypothetical protein RHMOL_Rhmol05G0124300 [Rhododendron molle]|uniref:Uncharacterized protein n=1 Tax=Rhododendron molle TaxID=49168 RepID=A0ACC0NNG9_RHOML|nr:hypothetical protein RHMOL_Rhmol05G0124300 [Rhododendron molle]